MGNIEQGFKMKAGLFLSIALIAGICSGPVYAAGEEGKITLDQRMIRLEERMIGLEERMIGLEERMIGLEVMLKERFEAINHRFEATNQRIEATNQRIDDLTASIESRFNFLYILVAALIGLMGIVINAVFGLVKQAKPVVKRQEQEDEVKVSIESMKKREARFEEEINLLKREVGLLKPQAA